MMLMLVLVELSWGANAIKFRRTSILPPDLDHLTPLSCVLLARVCVSQLMLFRPIRF